MMWHGPFGYADGGWGWLGPFHFLIPLLFFAIVATAVVLFVRYLAGWSGRPTRRSTGLDALAERYARGEINRDEFLEKKRDIAA
jgi:putative membrane protein